MWYNDGKTNKSVYQTAIVLDALRVYQVTGDQSFYDRAMDCYSWMESHLLRTNLDNLYWCDYSALGPVGQDRPEDITEAGSVVFLGGNMAMAVLHAQLYQMTGDANYLQRAIRTANAILSSPLATPFGVYLDDRDPNVEGTFAGDWAREVLTLSGVDPKHWTILWTTADSIYGNARTTNGCYGGSWSGPADGPGSPYWVNGAIPQVLAVSTSSANMVLAAAALEGQYTNLIGPRLQISLHPPARATVTNFGQPDWPYLLQSSTNLMIWNAVTDFYPVSGSFNFVSPINGSRLFFRAIPLVQP
jgi:hypothetical protein